MIFDLDCTPVPSAGDASVVVLCQNVFESIPLVACRFRQ